MGEVANETLEEMLASARRETEPRLGDSVRSVVKNVIHRAGIHSAVQQLWSGEAVVLFFHKIFPGPLGLWDEPVLSAEAFDQQLAFLTRNYEVVHLSELVRAIRGEAPFPSRAAVLTFDDGYRNNLLRAAPLLRRHRVPATLFVTSGLIGTEEWMWGYELEEMMFRYSVPQFGRAANDPFIHSVCARETSKYTALMVSVEYLKRLDDGRRREIVASLQRHLPVELDEDNRLLTWDEVRELREYGFELGAHTMTHPILPRVTPKQLEWEVAQSREVMERELGARPTLFSYPNGDCNAQVVEVVGRYFDAAVTTEPYLCTPQSPLLELPRIFAPPTVAELAHVLTRHLIDHRAARRRSPNVAVQGGTRAAVATNELSLSSKGAGHGGA